MNFGSQGLALERDITPFCDVSFGQGRFARHHRLSLCHTFVVSFVIDDLAAFVKAPVL